VSELVTAKAMCARKCAWPAFEGEAERPKMATHGTLCDGCYLRMKEALRLIPELILNMRAQVTPATSFELTERVQGGGDGAPVPLNVGAVDAADALFAKVGSWVGAFADELKLPPLSIRAYMVNAEIQGLRALAPIPASELTGQLTKWLSRHIDQIAASPTAATFHDDIWGGWEDSPGVTKLLGRYGSEGRKPKDALKRECPICGKREVFAAHPSLLNPDPMVLCGLCGWLANMEKFPHAKEMFESA
jgi:ribosomal protein S27AE